MILLQQKEAKEEVDVKPTQQQLTAAATSKKYELHPRKNKHKKRAPRGMHLPQQDVLVLSTAPDNQGELLLKNLQSELVGFKQRAQHNKQLLTKNNADSPAGIDTSRSSHVLSNTLPQHLHSIHSPLTFKVFMFSAGTQTEDRLVDGRDTTSRAVHL